MGPVERVGAESAIRVEGVGGQEARGGVLLVQYVYDTGEKIDRLFQAIGALQIDERIARNPSAPGRRDEGACTVGTTRLIGVVLVAMQIGAGNDAQVAAELQPRTHLVIEQESAGVARCQGNPVSGTNLDVAVGVRSAVGFGRDDKTGPKGGIDEAIRQMPLQGADFSAHREVQALPAGTADVVKVAGIGRRGDELEVVAIEGAKNVGTPVQAPLGEIAAQAYLECLRNHLFQIRV